jgi:hypothetical protein
LLVGFHLCLDAREALLPIFHILSHTARVHVYM